MKTPKTQMLGKVITIEFETQEMAEAFFKGIRAMMKTIEALRESGELDI